MNKPYQSARIISTGKDSVHDLDATLSPVSLLKAGTDSGVYRYKAPCVQASKLRSPFRTVGPVPVLQPITTVVPATRPSGRRKDLPSGPAPAARPLSPRPPVDVGAARLKSSRRGRYISQPSHPARPIIAQPAINDNTVQPAWRMTDFALRKSTPGLQSNEVFLGAMFNVGL